MTKKIITTLTITVVLFTLCFFLFGCKDTFTLEELGYGLKGNITYIQLNDRTRLADKNSFSINGFYVLARKAGDENFEIDVEKVTTFFEKLIFKKTYTEKIVTIDFYLRPTKIKNQTWDFILKAIKDIFIYGMEKIINIIK